MEILKYINKEVSKIDKQVRNKEVKISKLKNEIKNLKNKIDSETEKEIVIVRSQAKIKVLENKLKNIETEVIPQLDKEYIIAHADKEIIELNKDIKEKDRKTMKKIYSLLKELECHHENAKDNYMKLSRTLRNNKIQGHFEDFFPQGKPLRLLHFTNEITSDSSLVKITKHLGFGDTYKFAISKKDFE